MTMRTQEQSPARRAHSTPDPEDPASQPVPVPDDVPAPERTPVREPDAPEPPVKAG